MKLLYQNNFYLFFDSLYTTFQVKGNDVAESYLSLFVPAVAVIVAVPPATATTLPFESFI